MKVCCIFNVAALYRAPIFHLIDDSFDCDFYIGELMFKRMSYNANTDMHLNGHSDRMELAYVLPRGLCREGCIFTCSGIAFIWDFFDI